MTTLLVDNYDSYTYNVFHLIGAVTGEEPIVVHNDMVSWRALSRWEFDAIVLSPGPGRPERWHDFGVCADVLRHGDTPVLGVCLGHQGLGHMLDGRVAGAPVVMHGRLSEVNHEGAGLFAGIPQRFSAVRYHSLAVGGPLGPDGRVLAWTDDGVVMGIEHRRRPLWGVQFHPESIATEHGHRLFENFYALARRRDSSAPRGERPRPPRRQRRVRRPQPAGELELIHSSIDGEADAERLFESLFDAEPYAFWLDSADAPSKLAQRSFMGSSLGPERRVLEYDVDEKIVTSWGAEGPAVELGSIFDVLDRELSRHGRTVTGATPPGLIGGFVGYLGYECKADCGSPNAHSSDIPDAVLLFANRVVAIDHLTRRTHLFALSCDSDRADAERWLEQAEKAVRNTVEPFAGAGKRVTRAAHEEQREVTFRVGRGREQYLADIARCQAELAAGESYEVCLTDQIHTRASPPAFELQRELRRRNPAPFAAFLKLGGTCVVSSSPERFIAVDRDRHVQARPIKGTAPRSADADRDRELHDGLLSDEKTFAEHLMIVDLLRNDLGRVCALDSVRVPQFMVVEDYPTVHQLISTVTGLLDAERSAVECVRACFPGGSMTGAPKLRTMSIIDDIEQEARGVYSGAIGYFGVDGTVDLSIVIRTVVVRPDASTIGAGGAIVMQSDPADEFDELLLKARAPMAAVAQVLSGGEDWSVEEDSLAAVRA